MKDGKRRGECQGVEARQRERAWDGDEGEGEGEGECMRCTEYCVIIVVMVV